MKYRGNWQLGITQFLISVVGQDYQSEIMSEHVILGNDAIFKCSIPSFVTDFVQVEAWLDSEAIAHYQTANYGKHSNYCWPRF